MTFWDTDTWKSYERLCGDEPGTRARLLASADWQTRIVDLSLREAELWRGVRHSYRSLIHKAECEYVIQSVSGGCIYSAMKIHEQEAGLLTRPIQTWERQGEWIREGHALMIAAGIRRMMAVDEGTYESYVPGLIDMRAYVYCAIWDGWAYYFSSASLVRNVNHALIWHAMKTLKARGVRWFELGWMARAGDTDKDRQISFLKRGFGGYDIPAKEAPALCG